MLPSRVNTFRCPECATYFATIKDRNNHIKQHHPHYNIPPPQLDKKIQQKVIDKYVHPPRVIDKYYNSHTNQSPNRNNKNKHKYVPITCKYVEENKQVSNTQFVCKQFGAKDVGYYMKRTNECPLLQNDFIQKIIEKGTQNMKENDLSRSIQIVQGAVDTIINHENIKHRMNSSQIKKITKHVLTVQSTTPTPITYEQKSSDYLSYLVNIKPTGDKYEIAGDEKYIDITDTLMHQNLSGHLLYHTTLCDIIHSDKIIEPDHHYKYKIYGYNQYKFVCHDFETSELLYHGEFYSLVTYTIEMRLNSHGPDVLMNDINKNQ